jgi:hypothetical protein
MPQRPGERRAQVVVVSLEAVERDERPSRRALGIGRLGELEGEGEMARLHGHRLARLGKALPRVLSHRLEQAIAVAVGVLLGHHQRLVDESSQEVGDLALSDARTRRDLLRALQREAPGEDGEAAEERALGTGQQRVTPAQRGPERLLAIERRPAPGRQDGEGVAEPLGDLRGRERPHTSGGELQGERHPVQPRADLGHRAGIVLAQCEARRDVVRALAEQADRLVGGERLGFQRPPGDRKRQ